MAVESIRTAVQVRNIAGQHFFMASRKMAFGEVQSVRKLDNLGQEIRPRAKTFNDAGNLSASGALTPVIVSCGGFAGGIGILNDVNFRWLCLFVSWHDARRRKLSVTCLLKILKLVAQEGACAISSQNCSIR